MLSRNLLLAAKTHWLHRNDKHPLISRLQNSTFGGSERTTLNFEWLTWAFSRNRIALKNINKFWFLRISINRKQPFRCLINISADFSGDIYLTSMHHHFANHWKSILQFFYITIPVEKNSNVHFYFSFIQKQANKLNFCEEVDSRSVPQKNAMNRSCVVVSKMLHNMSIRLTYCAEKCLFWEALHVLTHSFSNSLQKLLQKTGASFFRHHVERFLRKNKFFFFSHSSKSFTI